MGFVEGLMVAFFIFLTFFTVWAYRHDEALKKEMMVKLDNIISRLNSSGPAPRP